MNVGDSVRKSIEDWEQRELDAAMLHACNAVDGTAKKLYPSVVGSNKRFTRLLRDNYHIFGPMAAPGMNLTETVFPISVPRPTHPSGQPDMADLVYGVHRCSHGHGDELPDGFALIPDAGGPPRRTRMFFSKGRAHLSDRVIFGLLAVAVLSPVNVGQHIPDGYFLTLGTNQLLINEWWGRANDFAPLVAQENLPNVKFDLGDWCDERSGGA